MKFCIVYFIILFSIFACKEQKDSVECFSMERVSVDLKMQQDSDFKQLFSEIEVIPLELNDSSIFKNVNKILKISDKYFLIADGRHRIILFDSKGNYVSNSSASEGEGPDEYFILQDVIYNKFTGNIEVMVPFGGIKAYDTHFNFVEGKKIDLSTNLTKGDLIKNFYALSENQYFVTTDRIGTVFLYDTHQNKLLEELQYTGAISAVTAVNVPFKHVDSVIYFTPPALDYYSFIFNKEKKMFEPYFYLDAGDMVSSVEEIEKIDPKEQFRYLIWDSPNYTKLKTYFSDNYIYSVFVKQQKTYFAISDRNAKITNVYYIDKKKEHIVPDFFTLEGDTLFALVAPFDLHKYVDSDLVRNKDMLKLDDDDNPCIVKYVLSKK